MSILNLLWYDGPLIISQAGFHEHLMPCNIFYADNGNDGMMDKKSVSSSAAGLYGLGARAERELGKWYLL
jgi:hypothetical protein